MSEKSHAQTAEPMQEIIDLLNQYAWNFDSNNMVRLRNLFCEDGVTEGKVAGTDIAWGPWKGSDVIAVELGNARESHPLWRRHQITTPFFVERGPDHATLNAYLSLFSCEDGQTPKIEVTGEYSAKVSKVGNAWKINSLRVVLDSEF